MIKKIIILSILLIVSAIVMFTFKSRSNETTAVAPIKGDDSITTSNIPPHASTSTDNNNGLDGFYLLPNGTLKGDNSSTTVRYTTTKISGGYDEYVHSRSDSLGTIYATTSSISNPYSSCEEEFTRTKPKIIDTNKIDKTNWSTFKESGYGFSMKIPAEWSVIPNDNFHKVISFNHGDNSIIITRLEPISRDFRGSITVCNQSEYYSMMVDNQYISRMKEARISEMGRHPYFHLCMMTDNACDYSIKLGETSYNIEYISYKNQTIDLESLIIMDEVVSTIESFKK